MFNVITKYKANANGTGQIKATGFGKQKTVNYDHSLNRAENYANAAAALLLANGYTGQGVDPESYTFREKDNAHIFTMGEK